MKIFDFLFRPSEEALMDAFMGLNADRVQRMIKAHPSLLKQQQGQNLIVNLLDPAMMGIDTDKRLKMLVALLNGGADPNGAESSLRPLLSAVQISANYGLTSPLEMLLRAGANPNVPVKLDNGATGTVLHHIARNRGESKENISILKRAGADLDRYDDQGFTPLHHCCKVNTEFAAKNLLDAGADVRKASKDGKTPMELCYGDAVRNLLADKV